MTDFLLISFVFLVAGVIAVPVASKLSLGSVLGYLIAGIVISPLLFVLKVDVISIRLISNNSFFGIKTPPTARNFPLSPR